MFVKAEVRLNKSLFLDGKFPTKLLLVVVEKFIKKLCVFIISASINFVIEVYVRYFFSNTYKVK